MQNILYGLLNGGLPQVGDLKADFEKNLTLVRQMAALHERLALIEMTKHEFLDKTYRKERTTFADGTTVTVDWDANTFEISPELKTP
jgi:predicted TIM-barrel fold metal-dependent hydrolase